MQMKVMNRIELKNIY